MICRDNFDAMNRSEIMTNGANLDYRVRVSVEFLNRCEYSCPGCFVNRRNSYTPADMQVLNDTIDMWKSNGLIFDELILGPTDFFASDNNYELIANPSFNRIFEDGSVVLTMLTVLQKDDDQIINLIQHINKHLPHPDQEIEMLIVVDHRRLLAGDIQYIEELKRKIQLLNLFDATIDYAMQINIETVPDLSDAFSLVKLADVVRREFDTIIEFNPSFARTKKLERITDALLSWKSLLNQSVTLQNKGSLTVTIANEHHAGLNEVTYNFKDSNFYHCPFVYENVFDSSDAFKIPKCGEEYTMMDFNLAEQMVVADQYQYALKTTECTTCPQLASCVGKEVLYYMKVYDIVDCPLAKDTIGICS